MCDCNDDVETTLHYLRKCRFFHAYRQVLCRNILFETNINLLLVPENDFVRLLLYGDPSLSEIKNGRILWNVSKFIDETERLAKFS